MGLDQWKTVKLFSTLGIAVDEVSDFMIDALDGQSMAWVDAWKEGRMNLAH